MHNYGCVLGVLWETDIERGEVWLQYFGFVLLIYPFKSEAQTALFKDPVRTAL